MSPEMFRLESRTSEWARQAGAEKRCNTNNYPGLTTEEYEVEVKKTWKDAWIKAFPDPPGTLVHTFSLEEVKVLAAAARISILTCRWSSLHEEELQEIVSKLEKVLTPDQHQGCNLVSDHREYFIRCASCSPKDGNFGTSPMYTAREMIEQITTSKRMLRPLELCVEDSKDPSKNCDGSLTLYLVPYNQIWKEHEDNEFRIFYHNRRVTAISQYHWFYDCGWRECGEEGKDLPWAVIAMMQFVEENKLKLDSIGVTSCIIDVICLPDLVALWDCIRDRKVWNVELIELNSFGKELSSGSALFEWLADEEILYASDGPVEVRYISEAKYTVEDA